MSGSLGRRLARAVEERVERAIAERTFPGCVIGLLRTDGSREIVPFGRLTYDEGEPVREDTVYDLASVTKSIPLSSLALELMAEGRFSLGHTVKMFIPELQNDYGATIEDLLRYRVQGPRLSELAAMSVEEMTAHIYESGFSGPPGEPKYSNLPALLLGIVLERATGERLDVLARKMFFEPLGMQRTTFFPKAKDCAPTEIVDGAELCGIVHDESARVFAREGRAVGHAGLFSAAGDLLTFCSALIGGAYPHIVDGALCGLGWQTDGDFLGANPTGRFGKTGFTGTSVALDTKRGIALVILSNRTYPKRPPDGRTVNDSRRVVADIVFDA